MKILGVIPSRFNSSRLPGKPLAMIGDASLVMRVYRRCAQVAELDALVVATDDVRIAEHVQIHGGKAVMTAATHSTGTERCAEVLRQFGSEYDWVVNIQGDEPFIEPAQIKELIGIFKDEAEIATLCKRIEDEGELFDPGIPKVVLSENHEALYFSRSTVPHLRNVPREKWISEKRHFKHIGIYGYRADILATLVELKPSMSEEMEQLEQLRWLSNGMRIKVVQTDFDSVSVDTPEDLEKARSYLSKL